MIYYTPFSFDFYSSGEGNESLRGASYFKLWFTEQLNVVLRLLTHALIWTIKYLDSDESYHSLMFIII